MTYATILRGFRFPVSALDAYLAENNIEETYGSQPRQKDLDEICSFLRSQMGDDDKDVCVFIPTNKDYNKSTTAYIAYRWVKVFAQRQIGPAELPESIPRGFEHLRQLMLDYGKSQEDDLVSDESATVGLFVVVLSDMTWIPQELQARSIPPISCDLCDLTSNTFEERQLHRKDVRNVNEGVNPLPNA